MYCSVLLKTAYSHSGARETFTLPPTKVIITQNLPIEISSRAQKVRRHSFCRIWLQWKKWTWMKNGNESLKRENLLPKNDVFVTKGSSIILKFSNWFYFVTNLSEDVYNRVWTKIVSSRPLTNTGWPKTGVF